MVPKVIVQIYYFFTMFILIFFKVGHTKGIYTQTHRGEKHLCKKQRHAMVTASTFVLAPFHLNFPYSNILRSPPTPPPPPFLKTVGHNKNIADFCLSYLACDYTHPSLHCSTGGLWIHFQAFASVLSPGACLYFTSHISIYVPKQVLKTF